MKCVSQAVSEHKSVHAIRKGNRLVVFRDVDASIAIEGTLESDNGRVQTVPMPYVVRCANDMSVREIHNEIRAAPTQPRGRKSMYLRAHMTATQSLFFSLPFFLRRLLIWRRLAKDPFFAKKTMGTVALTSARMFGKNSSASGWGIPIGIHPLVVLLGGIAKKSGVVRGSIAVRDYLSMTVLFDHNVVDGAPVARFLSRLKELIEEGYGLRTELTTLEDRPTTTRPGVSAAR
jgi:pyruvate/2-oxoglutarate dehydrogenase complex dihydrolipoamide acyltransferase (E2) component